MSRYSHCIDISIDKIYDHQLGAQCHTRCTLGRKLDQLRILRESLLLTLAETPTIMSLGSILVLSIALIVQNNSRTYLRKFSRSSRLQEDQERSLGFRPFTHSPDMMWDLPAQEEWSSSWFIPKLPKGKEGRGHSLQASHLLIQVLAHYANLNHVLNTKGGTGDTWFSATLTEQTRSHKLIEKQRG